MSNAAIWQGKEQSTSPKARICPRHVLYRTGETEENDGRCEETSIPTAGQSKANSTKATPPPIHRCDILHHKAPARTSKNDPRRSGQSTGIGTPLNQSNTWRREAAINNHRPWPTATALSGIQATTNTTKTLYILWRQTKCGNKAKT